MRRAFPALGKQIQIFRESSNDVDILAMGQMPWYAYGDVVNEHGEASSPAWQPVFVADHSHWARMLVPDGEVVFGQLADPPPSVRNTSNYADPLLGPIADLSQHRGNSFMLATIQMLTDPKESSEQVRAGTCAVMTKSWENYEARMNSYGHAMGCTYFPKPTCGGARSIHAKTDDDDDGASPLSIKERAPPTFPAGPQRFGVNVHFNWAGFQGLAASAAMIGSAFGSSRMDLSWSHVELSKGVYEFETTGYNGYVVQLLAATPPVTPYFILSYGNVLYDNACALADKHDGTCPPITDAGRQAFANFTVAAMHQWRGRGIIWEIWNEPNGGTWEPHSKPPGADFAKLVITVGKARNAAGLQGELLVGPALAGIDLPFIETIAQAGGLAYLDGVSVHPYRSGAPESVLGNYKELEALIDNYTLIDNNDRHRPRLISGEWGWPSCTFPNNGTATKCSAGGGAGQVVSEQLQAAWLVRQRYVNDLAGVAVSIWYDWVDDGPSTSNPEDNFGTIRHHQAGVIGGAGTPKLAYLAALASTALLGNCSLVARLNSSAAGSFALHYHCAGTASAVYVAWDSTEGNEGAGGETSAIVLPPSDSNTCFVTQDMFGASVCKAPPRCSPTITCAHGDNIAMRLTAQPQYLVRHNSLGPRLKLDDQSSSCKDCIPRWSMPVPDGRQGPSAGLRALPEAMHTVVAAVNQSFGTYSHGPYIAVVDNLLVVNWYNSERDEDQPGE